LIGFGRCAFEISKVTRWEKAAAEATGERLEGLMDEMERWFLRGSDKVRAALWRAVAKRSRIAVVSECLHEESTAR
jgi:hypothetical protein